MKNCSRHLLVIFFCFLPHLLLSQSDYASRLKAMRAEEVKIEKFVDKNIKRTPQSVVTDFQKTLTKNEDRPEGYSKTEIALLTESFKRHYWRQEYFKRFPKSRLLYDSPYTRFCRNGGFETGNLSGYTLEYVHSGTPGGGYDEDECDLDPSDYQFQPDIENANPDNFLVVGQGSDSLVPLNMVHSGDFAVRINRHRPLINPIGSTCRTEHGINKLSKRIILPDDRDSITFYYAVVLENPDGHDNGQPTFMARVLDSEGLEQDRACNSASQDDAFLNTQNSTPSPDCSLKPIKYQQWFCQSLYFDGEAGDTFYLEFYATDCGQGLHFGYAYVDDICARCVKDPCNDKGGLNLNPTDPCFDTSGFFQVCGTYDLPVLNCIEGSYESLQLYLIQDGVQTFVNLDPSQIIVDETAQTFCVNLSADDFPSLVSGPYDFKVEITFDVNGSPHSENDYHSNPGLGNDVIFDCPIDFCCKGNNWVNNGHFTNGNVGFGSDYTFESDHTSGSVTPGEYTVANSASALDISPTWDIGCTTPNQHLIINGNNNSTGNSSVWNQTVWVNDESTYSFCLRLKNLPACAFDVLPSVAVSFSLSDYDIPFTTIDLPTTGDCEWEVLAQMIEIPNGVNSLNISVLLDESSLGEGNDLAIDDILLVQLEEVPTSALLFSVTPFNVTSTEYSIEAAPLVGLPTSCSYEWSVAEVDANFDDITGTEVDNPVQWQTDPLANTFVGYNGTNLLSGSSAGVFEQSKRYRITYTRYCDCSLPNSFTVYLIPGKGMRVPQVKREDEIKKDQSRDSQSGSSTDRDKTMDELKSSFLVYPSPANKEVMLEFNDERLNEILIFSSNGQIMKRIQNPHSHAKTISVENWTDGLYFVQFKSESEILNTTRIIVESD